MALKAHHEVRLPHIAQVTQACPRDFATAMRRCTHAVMRQYHPPEDEKRMIGLR